MRVGIKGIRTRLGGNIHAGETRLTVGSIALAQPLSAVDPDIGVMHHALVTRPQLDSVNILRLSEIDRNDKIPKDVTAARPQPVRLGHLHN